jgi:DNA-binding transcriptional LysR family regulator
VLFRSEYSLGAKLFDRGKWGNRLTEAGQIAMRSAENLDWAIERVQEEIAAHAKGLQGPLKLGVAPSLAQALLPRVFSHLGEHASTLAANVLIGSDRTLLEALEHGEIELAISPVETDISTAYVVETTLAREPFLLALPSGHRLIGQPQVDIAEVVDEGWILPPSRSRYQQTIEAMFLASGFSLPSNVIITADPNLQESLAMATGRLCIINPSQFIGRSPPFALVPFLRTNTRAIGYRVLARQTMSLAATQMIDGLRSVLSEWVEAAQSLGVSGPT